MREKLQKFSFEKQYKKDSETKFCKKWLILVRNGAITPQSFRGFCGFNCWLGKIGGRQIRLVYLGIFRKRIDVKCGDIGIWREHKLV